MNLAEQIQASYGSPLTVVSNILRGCIIAKPGHVLRVGDFSSIEARGVAWLAGAERMLDTFRTGADIYCVAAEDIYGHPCNKKDHPAERGVGKVVILACGYQGAVGAFQSMARAYNVVVSDEDALKIVKAWRAKNPEIVSLWKDTEAAAIAAVAAGNKGTVFKCGAEGRESRFGMRGSFLVCRLPSGRKIYYPYPRLVQYIWIRKPTLKPVLDEMGVESLELDEQGQSKRVPAKDLSRWISRGWSQNGEPSAAVHYRYTDPLTKQWVEGPTYGGSLVENITQAICRDLLAGAMLRLSQRGYPIVMHVHDEIVTETPLDFGSTEELCAIMCEVPAWATGFPIAVGDDAYSRRRYKK